MTLRNPTLPALLATLALGGCGATPSAGPPAPASSASGLTTWGTLHAVMMEHDTAAVVSLATLTPDSTLYAVGALAGLRGEITIAGGDVWLARPLDDSLTEDTRARTADASACLLVAAHVAEWRDVPIEEAIPFDSLDSRVAALAAAAGLDTEKPFAFLIEGPLRDLQWHVIDGSRLDPAAAGHAAHLDAAVMRSLEHVGAGLVGFHSTAHQGVFTHRGSFTHVHAMIPAAQASGHVDHVVIEPGATLRVPVR